MLPALLTPHGFDDHDFGALSVLWCQLSATCKGGPHQRCNMDNFGLPVLVELGFTTKGRSGLRRGLFFNDICCTALGI